MNLVGPALFAHGVGGRTDLPVPTWMVGYGAAAVVLVSFAALALFWREPRLETMRPGPVVVGGAPSSRVAIGVLRALGFGLFALVLSAALFGVDEPLSNLAPTAIYVTFWVGLTIVCGLFGDLYALLDPFETLTGGGDDSGSRAYRFGMWPATAGLVVFVWLELVYIDGSRPRVLGVFLVALTATVVGGTMVYGRGFLLAGNPFRAWFGLLGAMAPLGRDRVGRLRVRLPLSGLSHVRPVPGMLALVVVALGSTAFDGVTRSTWWAGAVGDLDEPLATLAATAALLGVIAAVAGAYLAAMRVAAGLTGGSAGAAIGLAGAFAHSLVPIAFAYAVAHYLSLLLFEGQAFVALMSDPFGRGWDVFGTAANRIDFTTVSSRTISYLQVISIVAGHVAGVVLAHDRALALFGGRDATRSQYPLLVVMVAFTVGGLVLLLGG